MKMDEHREVAQWLKNIEKLLVKEIEDPVTRSKELRRLIEAHNSLQRFGSLMDDLLFSEYSNLPYGQLRSVYYG